MASSVLLFQRLRRDAVLPTRGTAGAIGLDLYACGHHVIEPMERRLVPIGFALAIPPGYYGRVAPRSGLAVRSGLDVLAGVIDSDYRGELAVVLINFGTDRVALQPGDRVAQLIMERAEQFEPAEIAEGETLPETARGTGGYGSTGR
jgi:dUTP pyrophosphatase